MTQTLEGPTRTRGKDSAPAIAWIRSVLQSRPGAQATDFAEAAGVSRKTVANLLGDDPRPALYSGTYHQIMATRPEDIRIPRRRIVDGTRAQEIVSSLAREGWTLQEIAEAGGVKRSTLAPQNLDSVYAETVVRLIHAKKVLDRRFRGGTSTPERWFPRSLFCVEPRR